jgi:hypothetical protein
VSLRNTAVGVGASCRSSRVSSKVLPVPLNLSFAFRAFRERRTSRGSSLGRIYVSSFGFIVCQLYICVCTYAHLKVGPTRFLIRKRFLDSRFPPPHGSNVCWSDLIAFIDKLKSTPPRQSCPTSRLKDRHIMVCTSSAIYVMTWWESA